MRFAFQAVPALQLRRTRAADGRRRAARRTAPLRVHAPAGSSMRGASCAPGHVGARELDRARERAPRARGVRVSGMRHRRGPLHLRGASGGGFGFGFGAGACPGAFATVTTGVEAAVVPARFDLPQPAPASAASETSATNIRRIRPAPGGRGSAVRGREQAREHVDRRERVIEAAARADLLRASRRRARRRSGTRAARARRRRRPAARRPGSATTGCAPAADAARAPRAACSWQRALEASAR